MNTLDTIYQRRSVRKYTDQPVTDADIQTMLRAAMFAPSARNSQPWDFIVIRDAETRKAISEKEQFLAMIKDAPVCIVVCVTPSKNTGNFPDFVYQDASAATQNILLAAKELGLGAVWCGGYPKEHIMEHLRGLLNVPAEAVPFNMIAIGNSAQADSQPERFDPGKIHNEKW